MATNPFQRMAWLDDGKGGTKYAPVNVGGEAEIAKASQEAAKAAAPEDPFQKLLRQIDEQRAEAKKSNEDRYAELLKLVRGSQVESATDQANVTGGFLRREAGGRADFARAQDEARAGYDEARIGYDEAGRQLEGVGNEALAETRRRGDSAKAAGAQSLISRGLYNSGAYDSANRRTDEATGRELRGIREMIATQKAGLFTQRAGFEAGRAGALGSLGAQAAGLNAELSGDVAKSIQAGAGLKQEMAAQERGIIERRQDDYPDLSLVANLLTGKAAADAQRDALDKGPFGDILGIIGGGIAGGIGGGIGKGFGDFFGGLFK